MHEAKGTFDVKMGPAPADDFLKDSGIAQFTIDKQYHGPLDAHSIGKMLASGGPAQGAGGYVAIEVVTGKLDGRSGSFALQHKGTMDKNGQQLSVTVVPGSGTGELAGIAGKMDIIIESGKHSYVFDYSLPEPSAK